MQMPKYKETQFKINWLLLEINIYTFNLKIKTIKTSILYSNVML